MTTMKPVEVFHAEERVMEALEARLLALYEEDDFAGGVHGISQYPPKFEDRGLSSFEGALRDWGFVYGLAFGLALRDNPELEHTTAARLAYRPAHTVYVRWSGEIENPIERRDRAIRAVVRRFDEADRATDNGLVGMTSQSAERDR